MHMRNYIQVEKVQVEVLFKFFCMQTILIFMIY